MHDRMDIDALGLRVRRLRQERGWSVLALAAGASLSSRYITEVEAGRANPSLKALDQLAEAFDLTLAQLLPKVRAAGPRQRIERLLERRTFDELSDLAREFELRFEQRQRRVITLLGIRGAGKSTLGRDLAERLAMPFIELDDLVASQAGLPVAELISLYGESYYRQIEQRCLGDVLAQDKPVVVAAGGGVVENLQSFDLLLRCALSVYLSAEAETLWERVLKQGDRRPMAGRDTALAQLRLLIVRREHLYAKAQLRVETDGRIPSRLVSDLVEDIQLLRADHAQLRQGS